MKLVFATTTLLLDQFEKHSMIAGCLSKWQDLGHDVCIQMALPQRQRATAKKILRKNVCMLTSENSYELTGLDCQIDFSDEWLKPRSVSEFFLDYLELTQPDFVLVDYLEYPIVKAAMDWCPAKTIVLLANVDFPRQLDLNEFPEIGDAYLKIQNVIVTSSLLERLSRAEIPWARTYCLPQPLPAWTEESCMLKPRHWIFTDATRETEIPFILELARKNPSEKFVFLKFEGKGRNSKLPTNVLVISNPKNVHEIFAKAKGFLAPSQKPMSNCKFALEAMALRLPVLTSESSCLTEITSSVYRLPTDIESWSAALKDRSIRAPSLQAELMFQVAEYRMKVRVHFRNFFDLLEQPSKPKLHQEVQSARAIFL